MLHWTGLIATISPMQVVELGVGISPRVIARGSNPDSSFACTKHECERYLPGGVKSDRTQYYFINEEQARSQEQRAGSLGPVHPATASISHVPSPELSGEALAAIISNPGVQRCY